jgi:sporulation protein YlmC with PRC-barrel domain
MFPGENLRELRGQKVIDPDGAKIGELEAIYVDTSTDEPAFATVRVGMIGRHRLVFVPLPGATVTPDAVRVQHVKNSSAMHRPSTSTASSPPRTSLRSSRTATCRRRPEREASA